jgi:hypothetical protein
MSMCMTRRLLVPALVSLAMMQNAHTPAWGAAPHRLHHPVSQQETIYNPDCEQRPLWDRVPSCHCPDLEALEATVFGACALQAGH